MTRPYSFQRVLSYAALAFIAFLILVFVIVNPVSGMQIKPVLTPPTPCPCTSVSAVVITIAPMQNQSSGIFSFGDNYNYSAVVLPNGSYVHQGENVTQGNYYDLSGVFGWSGLLAHWNDDYAEGITYPDKINDLTTINYNRVYFDPWVWPVGDYYQFDGNLNNPTNTYLNGSYFGADNEYVFHVVAPAGNETNPNAPRIVVHNSSVTVLQGGSSVQIATTWTEIVTSTPTPPPAVPTQPEANVTAPVTPDNLSSQLPSSGDVQDENGYAIAGGAAGAMPVTAPTPIPVEVPVVAVIMALVAVRWKG